MREGAERLRNAGTEGAARDARWLMADLLDVDMAGLLLAEDRPLTDAQCAEFDRRIAARLTGRPVSKITGKREFYGHLFTISDDTLDPRPETETLVELALEAIPLEARVSILDLGTGSGCILLSLLASRPNAKGVGTDISPKALSVASENATRLGLLEHAQFQEANWWPGQTDFDLIVTNPPYISASEMQEVSRDVRDWDPHIALTPGGDGLAAYREIAAGLSTYAKPDAPLFFEIGRSQAEDVCRILASHGHHNIRTHKDLNGHDRVVSAQNQTQ